MALWEEMQEERRRSDLLAERLMGVLSELSTLPDPERKILAGLPEVMRLDGPGIPVSECIYWFALYGDHLLPEDLMEEIAWAYEETYGDDLEDYEDLLKSQAAIKARLAA